MNGGSHSAHSRCIVGRPETIRYFRIARHSGAIASRNANDSPFRSVEASCAHTVPSSALNPVQISAPLS